MSRADIIKEATLNARKSWLNYGLEQEKHLYNLLRAAANNIIEEIEKYTVAGKVPPERLNMLYGIIKKEMKLLNPKLRDRIFRMMSNSIDFAFKTQMQALNAAGVPQSSISIGSSFIDASGVVHKWDAAAQLYPQSVWAQLNGDVMAHLANFNPQGITLSERIWDITWKTEKALRSVVETAVIQGKSAASVSRLVRGYLYKPDKLYRRVRKDGKLVLSKAAAAYHPGTGTYRSAYQNAMRLARTEMARAFAEGTVRYGQQKTFIEGYIWRTGGANPCPECSPKDGEFYAKDDVGGIPEHPQCLCYWELKLVDAMDKFLDDKPPEPPESQQFIRPKTLNGSIEEFRKSHGYDMDFYGMNLSNERKKNLMDSVLQEKHYMANRFPTLKEHNFRQSVEIVDGDHSFLAQTKRANWMRQSEIKIHYKARASKYGDEYLASQQKLLNSVTKYGRDKWTISNASDLASAYRHETGHNVWFSSRAQEQKNIFRNLFKSNSKAFRNFSQYAATQDIEAFAEVFAFYSTPGYQAGMLNEVFKKNFTDIDFDGLLAGILKEIR